MLEGLLNLQVARSWRPVAFGLLLVVGYLVVARLSGELFRVIAT